LSRGDNDVEIGSRRGFDARVRQEEALPDAAAVAQETDRVETVSVPITGDGEIGLVAADDDHDGTGAEPEVELSAAGTVHADIGTPSPSRSPTTGRSPGSRGGDEVRTAGRVRVPELELVSFGVVRPVVSPITDVTFISECIAPSAGRRLKR
jgi:hypothetical protein